MIGVSQFPSIYQLMSHASSGNFFMLMYSLEIFLKNGILRVVFNIICSCGFLHSSNLDVLGDAWNRVYQHITPPEWSGSLPQNVNLEPEGSNSKRVGSEKSWEEQKDPDEDEYQWQDNSEQQEQDEEQENSKEEKDSSAGEEDEGEREQRHNGGGGGAEREWMRL